MGRRVGAAHCRRTLPLRSGCRQSVKTLLPKAGLTRKRKVRVQRLMDFDRYRAGGRKNESRTRGLPGGPQARGRNRRVWFTVIIETDFSKRVLYGIHWIALFQPD